MENETKAIILKEDPNKSLRFVYLALLMGKKNVTHMQTLVTKLGQIKLSKQELNLHNLPQSVSRLIPSSIVALHS